VSKEPRVTNPFYVLLMIAGTLFGLTACAYFVMALRMKSPETADLDPSAPLTLVTFLDRHGVALMLVEVGALAVLTIGAIATDGYWTRRAKRREQSKS
jgi:hypothetical protein